MSGYWFPASLSSTHLLPPPWNLPGWQGFSLILLSTTPPPRPYSPRLSSFHCELALCSVCFADSLGPVPSGANSPWGLHIHSIPRMSFWQQLCRADGTGSFGALWSSEPIRREEQPPGSGCSFRLLREGLSDPAGRDRAYHHSDPHISSKGPGWECYGNALNALLSPTLREMWLFSVSGRETSDLKQSSWILGPGPAPLALSFPHPSLTKEKEGQTGLLIWLVWGWTSLGNPFCEKRGRNGSGVEWN